MSRLFLVLLLLLSLAALSFAQMTVQATTPADGATGVALTTTISISFSLPIDTSARYMEGSPIGLLGIPDDSVTITGVSFSTDLRTIRIAVILRPNTDYCLCVLAARSTTTQTLQHPVSFNFTTIASNGSRSITGQITYSGGSVANAVVALSDRRPFENVRLVRGTVYSTTLSQYQITGVRSGRIYWVVSGLDVNGDGVIDPSQGDAIGTYDANRDGQPDSVILGTADLTNINIALFTMTPTLALQNIATARNRAMAFDSNATLMYIYSDNLTLPPNGTSMGWQYTFDSPRLRHTFSVRYSSMGAELDTNRDHNPTIEPGQLVIPQGIVNSDSAIRVAERNGGATFRSTHPQCLIRMNCGNYRWVQPGVNNRFFWEVNYFSDSSPNPPGFTAYIDLLTGQLYSTVSAPEQNYEQIPSKFELLTAYPNPFNATTTIRYTLSKSEEVRIGIFDINGRTVANLIEGKQPAGSYSVKWDGSQFASGVYLIRFNAGDILQTHKIVLLK